MSRQNAPRPRRSSATGAQSELPSQIMSEARVSCAQIMRRMQARHAHISRAARKYVTHAGHAQGASASQPLVMRSTLVRRSQPLVTRNTLVRRTAGHVQRVSASQPLVTRNAQVHRHRWSRAVRKCVAHTGNMHHTSVSPTQVTRNALVCRPHRPRAARKCVAHASNMHHASVFPTQATRSTQMCHPRRSRASHNCVVTAGHAHRTSASPAQFTHGAPTRASSRYSGVWLRRARSTVYDCLCTSYSRRSYARFRPCSRPWRGSRRDYCG